MDICHSTSLDSFVPAQFLLLFISTHFSMHLHLLVMTKGFKENQTQKVDQLIDEPGVYIYKIKKIEEEKPSNGSKYSKLAKAF